MVHSPCVNVLRGLSRWPWRKIGVVGVIVSPVESVRPRVVDVRQAGDAGGRAACLWHELQLRLAKPLAILGTRIAAGRVSSHFLKSSAVITTTSRSLRSGWCPQYGCRKVIKCRAGGGLEPDGV